MHTRGKGQAAEDMAVGFLEELGYKILERNYQAPGSEIDIICVDGEETVFVEVKSVIETPDLSIFEAISQRKLARVKLGALHWLSAQGSTEEKIRLDFVGIVLDTSRKLARIEHLKHI